MKSLFLTIITVMASSNQNSNTYSSDIKTDESASSKMYLMDTPYKRLGEDLGSGLNASTSTYDLRGEQRTAQRRTSDHQINYTSN